MFEWMREICKAEEFEQTDELFKETFMDMWNCLKPIENTKRGDPDEDEKWAEVMKATKNLYERYKKEKSKAFAEYFIWRFLNYLDYYSTKIYK